MICNTYVNESSKNIIIQIVHYPKSQQLFDIYEKINEITHVIFTYLIKILCDSEKTLGIEH